MPRLHKDFRKAVTDAGARVLSVKHRGSGHLMVELQAPDGRTTEQVFAATPSDHRAALNQRAAVRRFVRATA